VTDPRAEYASRVAGWDADIARGEARYHRIANLRAADILLTLLLGWAAIEAAVSVWWLAAPAVAFVALVVWHERVARRNDLARRARRWYARGLARLDGTWAGAGPDGARFLDDHAFARDLDLFGTASLFQLVDTAQTQIGEETLADWLRRGAAIDEIVARQVAIDELRSMVEYREAIAVIAVDVHAARTSSLAAFAASPPVGFSAVARNTFHALAGASALLTVVCLAGRLPFSLLAGWVILQSGVVLAWRRQLEGALARVDVATSDLTRLKTLLMRLEGQPFAAPRLAALRDALITGGLPPSQCIARLERLVSMLDSCRNQMFLPIAMLFLVRSQLIVAIDRWHAAHGPAIATWLSAVGEIEALSALATYAFEHPADPFPTLVEHETVFDAQALGHPLIADAVAVRNDVRLGAPGPRVLVVGVNVVLALAGAPVRAASLRLSRLALGATLRIEDSLQEGHSKFYAEILRIRAIVDIARGPVPLLFLLDEILGGTNSHDRRLGAEAIVGGLVTRGAIGLVTTHDLALTELVGPLGPAAANVHFEDRIEDGKILFDYRMRPGVVEHSNALALMHAIGLVP
jgi:hypothetical protein